MLFQVHRDLYSRDVHEDVCFAPFLLHGRLVHLRLRRCLPLPGQPLLRRPHREILPLANSLACRQSGKGEKGSEMPMLIQES